MKTLMLWLALGLWLACTSCQSGRPSGLANSGGGEAGLGSSLAGASQGSSAPSAYYPDYEQVLADPGPF